MTIRFYNFKYNRTLYIKRSTRLRLETVSFITQREKMGFLVQKKLVGQIDLLKGRLLKDSADRVPHSDDQVILEKRPT